MKKRLGKIIKELENLIEENWETGEFGPDLLNTALQNLKDARRGVRGDNRGDSDRGICS